MHDSTLSTSPPEGAPAAVDASADGATFRFDNSYAARLEGLYRAWQPAPAPEPRLRRLNTALAAELDLDVSRLGGEEGAHWFSGHAVPPGATPIAQAYAGHQFGGFSPQLGDGRALLLGEVIDTRGRRRDVALKGSGRTPFSRGGDGKAALGPVLREYLVGEAMHALGIPTTRALAVATTGELIRREGGPLPGAVLTRVAASHLRVGTFEFFAARGDLDNLRRLADYAIERHDPELVGRPDRIVGLLEGVARRQVALVAQWMAVGFIHGVMNTDNMTISGETIDYGPCAFMETFDPQEVFSSIDHHGRYAYANQPPILQWNLVRLAEALLSLVPAATAEEAVDQVRPVIEAVPGWFEAAWVARLGAKLGFAHPRDDDASLLQDWLALMHEQRMDFTLAWRRLAEAAEGDSHPLRALAARPAALDGWLERWMARLRAEGSDPATLGATLRRVNPLYIPRNHRVEEALAAAQEGDDAPFEALLAAVSDPFEERPGRERFTVPAPPAVTDTYLTFCGT